MLGYIISKRSERREINVEKYEIKSFDILHKTDLNIFVVENDKVLYVNDIIFNASKNGHVKVLEWFKNSGYEFKYNQCAIDFASGYGHIKVLEWFKNSGYEFKYDRYAIINACNRGHIKVLEWFKNSGYELKYDKLAINEACKNGHVQVLEWFKNSEYEFKYDKYVLRTKFLKILKFFSNIILGTFSF